MSNKRVSSRKASRDARVNDALARATQLPHVPNLKSHDTISADSFQNFAANMGLGTDNISSGASYGFNPITRNRTMLEWIHRGSWVGGIAVDVIADDMTRAGVTVTGLAHPGDAERIKTEITRLKLWKAVNETIKWSRLYGGALAVMLIDGQDMRTPLRLDTIEKGQFKGLTVLDRWYCNPRLDDMVDEYCPEMGMPRFYEVAVGAPALSGKTIHYTRVLRLDGVALPWNQRLQENLWGISVIERLYDRMVAFDSATTGAAQLIYKAYIRTLKIKGYKEMVGENGPAAAGLSRYIDMMRRYQSVEGINVIDANDAYENLPPPGFSGLSEALMQFGQQLAGALQVPLVRLFGQSPTGMSATGESDMRTYYDGIKHRQEEQLLSPVTLMYQAIARSLGIKGHDGDIGVMFNPLWQVTENEKSEIANKDAGSIRELFADGVICRSTALRELRITSSISGRFGTITDEMIAEADDEGPPMSEDIPEPTGGNQPQMPQG